MSTEATTGDKRKADEQTVSATDDEAKKSVLTPLLLAGSLWTRIMY